MSEFHIACLNQNIKEIIYFLTKNKDPLASIKGTRFSTPLELFIWNSNNLEYEDILNLTIEIIKNKREQRKALSIVQKFREHLIKKEELFYSDDRNDKIKLHRLGGWYVQDKNALKTVNNIIKELD